MPPSSMKFKHHNHSCHGKSLCGVQCCSIEDLVNLVPPGPFIHPLTGCRLQDFASFPTSYRNLSHHPKPSTTPDLPSHCLAAGLAAGDSPDWCCVQSWVISTGRAERMRIHPGRNSGTGWGGRGLFRIEKRRSRCSEKTKHTHTHNFART